MSTLLKDCYVVAVCRQRCGQLAFQRVCLLFGSSCTHVNMHENLRSSLYALLSNRCWFISARKTLSLVLVADCPFSYKLVHTLLSCSENFFFSQPHTLAHTSYSGARQKAFLTALCFHLHTYILYFHWHTSYLRLLSYFIYFSHLYSYSHSLVHCSLPLFTYLTSHIHFLPTIY